jgi:GNAT superfamily N-acetyltransferase
LATFPFSLEIMSWSVADAARGVESDSCARSLAAFEVRARLRLAIGVCRAHDCLLYSLRGRCDRTGKLHCPAAIGAFREEESLPSSLVIRSLKPADRANWEPLWRGYQTFYKVELAPEVTQATWRRFFDGLEPMHALVAEDGGELVGVVHYLFHRSTWMVGPICYLQDLFTAEKARGKGVGKALIEAVYAQGSASGASRVYWHTHETNATARSLYDRVATLSGFVQYRKES